MQNFIGRSFAREVKPELIKASQSHNIDNICADTFTFGIIEY